jgi:hypothetical protein
MEDAVRQAEVVRDRALLAFGTLPPAEEVVRTLFFYLDREDASYGARLAPVFKDIGSQGHYCVSDQTLSADLEEDVASTVLANAYGEMSYSQLLRIGAVEYARVSESDLLDYGAQLVRDARWCPLRTLQVGSAAEDVVATEAALLIRHVLHSCAAEGFRTMWMTTAAVTQFYSIDSALRQVCGMSRQDVESLILGELLGDSQSELRAS